MPHKHLLRLWVGSIFLLVSLSVKNYLPVNALAQVDKLVPDAGGVIHYPAAPAPAVSSRAARLYLQSPAAELDPMAFDALTYGITRDYLNGGGDTLTWLSIYADEAWISVDPASLVIPPGETRSLTVYVDRYGLADGSHASTVRLLRDTGITDYFNVSMEVASFAMTGADFGCVEQAASYSLDLPQDRLEIPFSWQVEAQPSWLTNVTPSSGMVASGSGTETIHLDFTVDPAGQPAGQNSGYMLWTTTAGHYVFPFQATFGCAGRATWVWGQSEAIIEDWGGARGEFFDFLDAPHGSAANKINTVYLYIPGGYLTDPVRKATLHGFLQQAAYRGLQIHYMPPGEAKIWVVSDDLLLDGQAIIDLVLQFNAETSVLGERFKGIHLDIEPAENDGWSTHSQEYWGRFESLLAYGRQQIDAYNLAHTAISFGADLVTYQPWYGADVDGDGADYEDVFANVDVLTTMDYSDHAYDQPEDLIYGSYGLITRVSPVLAYAESIGKSVVVGVETDNLTIKGNPHLKDWMTFYEEGYSPVMEYELGQLSAHFASQPAFWKVAIHPYGVYTRLNPSGGVPEDISPIATTTSHMNPGETKSIWVTLGSIVKVIRVVVGWQGSTVEASLFDPYGRVITPAEAENDPHISYYQGANFTVYYVSSPAVGVWEVQLYGADLPEGGEEVTLAVYASNTPKTFLPLAQYGNQPQPPGATRTPTSTPTRTPTRTLAPTATPYPSATPTVTPTPLSWNIVTVDIAGDVGYYASLGLDQFGYAHLSYIDFDVYALKYAYEDVAGWHTQIVDSDGGTYAALVVDPSNYPHISYAASSQLRYAYLDGTGWHTQVVDSGGLSAVNTSLVLDDSGYAHISYRNGVNGELRYAYQDSSGWHTQIVDNANQFASATSIHLDDSNYPHIGYYDQTNGYLMYAYLDAAGWHIQIVDGADQVGSSVSLRLDSNHYPHLSYYDSTNSDLKYAYQDASGWHIMVVDSEGNVGTFTSLRLDMNGYPHISYRDQGHGDLKYAYRDAAGWHIHTVDTQDSVGIYTSLVLDANGYPHIGYHDYTNGDLKYAWVSP